MVDLICDFYMELAPHWISENLLGRFFRFINNRIKNKTIRNFINLLLLLLVTVTSIGLAIGILILAVWGLMLLKIV